MVEVTLRELDVWYSEPTQGSGRPKLLAKLAILELCGWIEGEFDRLVMQAQNGRLHDPDWVRAHVVSRTYGFTYTEHLRPMVAKVVGEIFARRIEEEMERTFPGQLDRLKSLLASLWRQRCQFAHSDLVANVAAQQTFSAPSWSINQHRIVTKLIAQYEQSMLAALAAI